MAIALLATWNQSFTYDAFGNISKSGSGSFMPTYTASTNHYSTLPVGTPTYDANGNVLTDGFHTYNWDAEGHLQHIEFDNSTWTYDALGRPVEKTWTASSPVQLIYAPQGNLLALMNGQNFQAARLPLPGGVRARYALGQSLPTEYHHPDWLGTSRLASNAQTRAVDSDVAFAPFGEQYVSTSLFDSTFTGVAPHDKAPDLYDFAAREYHPTQGRWISPDPAGLAAVDMTDPQTLNRYGYVRNNPLALVDPFGLCDPNDQSCFSVTGTAIAPTGSDSFLYQIYFLWYYGLRGAPGGVGTGGGGNGTPSNKKPTAKPNEKVCPAVPVAPPKANLGQNIATAESSVWMIFAPPRFVWFNSQVRNKGPWDYKQQGQSLSDLGTWQPSPYQNFGNFNFGATGAAAGIPLQILLRGAGWAQGRAGTSNPAFGRWYGGPPYGDDPNDQALIQAGFDYYTSGCAQ